MSHKENLNFQNIHQSLLDQSYATVPFPIEPFILEAAIEAFFKFLREPEYVKSHIDFTIAPLHRRGDVGFKHRDSQDDIYNDSKDFFHFHPALFERYPDFLEAHPVVKDFVLTVYKFIKPECILFFYFAIHILFTLNHKRPDRAAGNGC